MPGHLSAGRRPPFELCGGTRRDGTKATARTVLGRELGGAGEGNGPAVGRVGDEPLLRGARPYTDDLREPEALCAVFVRSEVAHATIGGIDASAAADAPGVV